ncbi:hypothetical protein FSW04_20725 [Baekduia soli]|uniref:Uncharacterized protein n=1 Tax=Baekduia soli TaxID=496014 RepID=A0A5B8U9D4_9ACTN|nr:hypothetical protein [Baekduia soli]QEC49756.1 hypothetical protein FSW04_20725 [Baekduia soli]
MSVRPMSPAPPRNVLRALFDEAWGRARRRRRRIAALVVLAAVGGALVTAVRGGDGPGGPAVGERPAAGAARTVALVLPRAPGMGVACPVANSIACDRVGIAAWLSQDAVRVVATVGGRSVVLQDRHIRCPTARPCPRFYTGALQPAGLLDGALEVTPDHGADRWYGRHPVSAPLRITPTYADGTRAVTTRTVPLAPGWG